MARHASASGLDLPLAWAPSAYDVGRLVSTVQDVQIYKQGKRQSGTVMRILKPMDNIAPAIRNLYHRRRVAENQNPLTTWSSPYSAGHISAGVPPSAGHVVLRLPSTESWRDEAGARGYRDPFICGVKAKRIAVERRTEDGHDDATSIALCV